MFVDDVQMMVICKGDVVFLGIFWIIVEMDFSWEHGVSA